MLGGKPNLGFLDPKKTRIITIWELRTLSDSSAFAPSVPNMNLLVSQAEKIIW